MKKYKFLEKSNINTINEYKNHLQTQQILIDTYEKHSIQQAETIHQYKQQADTILITLEQYKCGRPPHTRNVTEHPHAERFEDCFEPRVWGGLPIPHAEFF